MTSILLEKFEGDPNAFYGYFKDEIEKCDIPDCELLWEEESYHLLKPSDGGFFSSVKVADEKVPCRAVSNGVYKVRVLAMVYGETNFFISCRTGWYASIEMKQEIEERENQGRWEYLDDVHMNCFTTLVRRCFDRALKRYLEYNQKEVPDSLKPEEVFVVES